MKRTARIVLDPDRYQYRECFVRGDAIYDGKPVSFCPYKLVFPFVDGEETSDLLPLRVGAGFRGSLAYSVTNLQLLADNTT
ncbi:hypothetical protein KDX27_10180 [Burkholderia cenocepacia]|uniref:hypothetical protein n=1 Tax=Burkholderia cenocepacia TaxID=95486 RepID=UPI001B971730|nr:hypothetical protein [Burkholderia cenocepacia]MBR8168075.1 hypothetical protein [Burkholderia cenocepacia]